jgi:hypothetical protein
MFKHEHRLRAARGAAGAGAAGEGAPAAPPRQLVAAVERLVGAGAPC